MTKAPGHGSGFSYRGATSDGDRLPIVSIGPGLPGVALPPGATLVQLRYRNVPLAMAFVLSWRAVAGALVALLISARRGQPVRNP
jgi:hypothetical protein